MARFTLAPTDRVFFDLFKEAGDNALRSAKLLQEMIEKWPDESESLGRDIFKAEQEGDRITHDIIKRVNSTFVTPFDREDIYALASGLDDVMDFMEEAVDLVLLYEIGDLPSELANMVEVLQRAAELTADAMPRLRTMRDLEEFWIEINRLENDGDKSYRRIVAKLFNGQYDALTVMKLKDVVDSLEAGIDAFETVANIVEQIAVKES